VRRGPPGAEGIVGNGQADTVGGIDLTSASAETGVIALPVEKGPGADRQIAREDPKEIEPRSCLARIAIAMIVRQLEREGHGENRRKGLEEIGHQSDHARPSHIDTEVTETGTIAAECDQIELL
jgi:hypothetical protein